MLEMERTTEGSIRVRNRRQSEVVRDATEARRVAHHWGHTTLSIDKALAEMTRDEGTQEEERSGWQVRRPARKATPEAKRAARPAAAAKEEAKAPAPEAKAEPEAKPKKKATARPKRSRRSAPKAEAAPEPAVVPQAEAPAPAPEPAPAPAPEAKKPARRRTRKAAAAKAEPAAAAPAEPRARALELARELARELRSIENAELAFARGPWAELRESAEHVVACLSGKRAPRAARGGPAPG